MLNTGTHTCDDKQRDAFCCHTLSHCTALPLIQKCTMAAILVRSVAAYPVQQHRRVSRSDASVLFVCACEHLTHSTKHRDSKVVRALARVVWTCRARALRFVPAEMSAALYTCYPRVCLPRVLHGQTAQRASTTPYTITPAQQCQNDAHLVRERVSCAKTRIRCRGTHRCFEMCTANSQGVSSLDDVNALLVKAFGSMSRSYDDECFLGAGTQKRVH